MKKTKFLCGLLAMALVLSLASCSNSSGGSDDSSSDGEPQIVTFGTFPQSLKARDVSITSESKVVGSYTYYKGSDKEWYAKLGSKYYKVEPIKWRVLTENYDHDSNASTPGKKLLLAENILINCMYYDYYDVNRTIGTAPIYPNNYEHSRIRAFLNGLYYEKKSDSTTQSTDSSLFNKGFLQTAFTTEEQDAIAETIVDNTKEGLQDAAGKLSTSETYVCPNTPDKIFLLSEKEVTTSAYGFAAYDAYIGDPNGTTTSTRIRMTTDFAKDSGAFQSTKDGYGGYWWLRSPNSNRSDWVRYVYHDGDAMIDDGLVNEYSYGVVPALCLN